MAKINVLEPSVFNMLAAGEVVERPASVVKELAENSIDAGATVIDISIEEGGLSLIKVSDNGIGILPEDMRAAFLPHATSKLKNITDLDSLSTLGFRGEALASIASVSEISLVSAARGASVASKIELSGGKVTFEGLDSRSEGTLISVRNLFFNTPARLKFLKKPSIEQRYVVDTVEKLILANPELSISLTCDGEETLSHDGGSLFDAVCAVMNIKSAKKMLRIEQKEQASIRVSGYVSAPDNTKSNRTGQTVIVNGRAVVDQIVQTAVEKAYGDLLMKRSYPLFVLDIIMPFDELDVNVHPSKTEVRFMDRQAVFSAVYHAVYDTLHTTNSEFGFDVSGASNAASSDNANNSSDETSETFKSSRPALEQSRIDTARLLNLGSHAKRPAASGFKDSALPAYSPEFTDFGSSNKGAYGGETEYRILPPVEEDEEQIGVFDGKIVGQIFATYMIVERDGLVYLIDQHAAHERVLYDKIVKNMTPQYSQPLLIPYKLYLSAEEESYFEKLLDPLSAMGFDIEKSGANYLINAVPSMLARINFSQFFKELFATYTTEDAVTLASIMRDSLCQQACKAAIKGGETLTREQIERVIKNYVDENGALPTHCPHGRPAVIAFTKTDIEKLFKRIV